MRFEVPQFIEIEDKIFGPFTWKQFVYLLGGAGALFVLYVTLPFIIFLILGAPIAALSLSLAFYEINNRPFSILLEACVMYLTKARLYLWKKEDKKVIPTGTMGEAQGYVPPAKTTLASLSRQLEISALRNKR